MIGIIEINPDLADSSRVLPVGFSQFSLTLTKTSIRQCPILYFKLAMYQKPLFSVSIRVSTFHIFYHQLL